MSEQDCITSTWKLPLDSQKQRCVYDFKIEYILQFGSKESDMVKAFIQLSTAGQLKTSKYMIEIPQRLEAVRHVLDHIRTVLKISAKQQAKLTYQGFEVPLSEKAEFFEDNCVYRIQLLPIVQTQSQVKQLVCNQVPSIKQVCQTVEKESLARFEVQPKLSESKTVQSLNKPAQPTLCSPNKCKEPLIPLYTKKHQIQSNKNWNSFKKRIHQHRLPASMMFKSYGVFAQLQDQTQEQTRSTPKRILKLDKLVSKEIQAKN